MRILRLMIPMLILAAVMAACSPTQSGVVTGTTTGSVTGTANTASHPFCVSPSGAKALGSASATRDFGSFTPQQFRDAYGVTPLINEGYTGKGQTVVVIDSYGSPTLQSDIDAFDQQYHLPAITLQILSPLGTKPFDPNNQDMNGWAGETSLDVQVIHSIAPGAAIVVLTSPVDETEGTTDCRSFSNWRSTRLAITWATSCPRVWGASEVTLEDSYGQQEIAQWTKFYQQATTQNGITFFTGSGDNGATDYANCMRPRLFHQGYDKLPLRRAVGDFGWWYDAFQPERYLWRDRLGPERWWVQQVL